MATYVFAKIVNQLDKIKNIMTQMYLFWEQLLRKTGDFRNSKVFDIMKKLDEKKINYSVVDPYFSKVKNKP